MPIIYILETKHEGERGELPSKLELGIDRKILRHELERQKLTNYELP